MGELDEYRQNVDVVGLEPVVGAAGDECSGEFEGVHRQVSQVGQVGVAGAEVVDGDPDTDVGQRAQRGDRLGLVPIKALSVSSSCRGAAASRCREDPPDVVDEAGFADLPGGEVHAHQQLRTVLVAPLGGLPARLAQHGAAQRHDQAGLLGERDELARRQQLTGGSCHRTRASTPMICWSRSRTSG